jgi:hypothetical protein
VEEAFVESDKNHGVTLRQPNSMGFYNWSLSDNRIWGDANFASLFSIDRHQLVEGVPVERFLACIAEEDRPRIALAVHQAITTGIAYSETYKVAHPDGSRRQVTAFGRCLRNEDGIPLFFSGAAMDDDSDHAAVSEDPLLAHCKAALELAKQRDRQMTVRHLEAALFTLK